MDMRFFDYEHLPYELRAISGIMHDTAWTINNTLPNGPEKSAGLRKLLEAKDCFVRAGLNLPVPEEPVEYERPVAWTHIPRPCTRNLVGLPCDCGQCTHIRNVAKDTK